MGSSGYYYSKVILHMRSFWTSVGTNLTFSCVRCTWVENQEMKYVRYCFGVDRSGRGVEG